MSLRLYGKFGAAPFLFAVAAVLMLFAGACSPQEDLPREPTQTSGPKELSVVSSPVANTPRAKVVASTEKTLIPTPTTLPQVSPAQTRTGRGRGLEIVIYDEPTKLPYVNPPVEEEIPTPLPPVSCDERLTGSALHTLVTKEYGLSEAYAPDDLVALADYLPYGVTVGYPSEVREIIVEPLVEMVNDMLEEGLQPWILSGYRSYAAQALSWDKWNRLYPETAAIVSALPGHSEHQLGTVVDFGSPELAGIVGQPGIEFHTYFYKTSEGQWLLENAYKYGFTLSFTKEAFDTTGFYYEPWHYRYVGKEMAAMLHEQNVTLIEYLLSNEPPPCTP